ncbi:uncharacterized protein LOC126894547 [Daktulosphaira vitifoliae]|uniref:uncharacterized protein LOC126894547 n=1 Tax=Daktulosphaira vitifoliae TaxID=58002 RepID=UPI0021A990C6|nr:uncharacterized protein LOC126894547 [Daktulosphaira vitifoliae]
MDMDLNQLFHERNIDDEVIKLKNELYRTKNALTNQIFKRHQIVDELSSKFYQKNYELKKCQQTNFQELGKVLRSLYIFESKLRREQQQIRRQLGERDAVIKKQQIEIAKLKQCLASYYHKNEPQEDNETSTSKPDLITSISPQTNGLVTKSNDVIDSTNIESLSVSPNIIKLEGVKKNILTVVDVSGTPKKATKNNINFNKNVYSKTVTDLSLNDISSFPNPTPNNNLFVVSNSVFSKSEFTYNDLSKEMITPTKQNGKIIPSALKKGDKFPCPKSVHFGKTTHIPEPDEDNQTDIVKTVETLLLQCGDSTESENETSSTASTETSPSVSQMVRKFESICITPNNLMDAKGQLSPINGVNSRSYIADNDLKVAAELKTDSELTHSCTSALNSSESSNESLGDLDPRNNFEEFRFEDCDLEKEYSRSEADGNEFPIKKLVTIGSGTENCCNGTNVNYESFLEVTGLSQKSIITVQSLNNRNVYGTHRNVQKPKDVKSRSRAKSASFEFKSPSLTFPSTIKYWTEPYL